MESTTDLGFREMQEIQRELQDKYKDKWEKLCPEASLKTFLWLMIELGEAADVIKKEGNESIMKDDVVRRHFLEELADVMMYFNDALLCYDISIDEFKEVYLEKHRRNMERW